MLLDESLQANHIGVCVKDTNKRVLQQNSCCKEICGERMGETCNVGCMEYYADDDTQQWKEWGSRIYKNSYIHNGFYDVTLISSAENIITFLQPLKEMYRKALDHYKDKGLTRRETEIISLAIKGKSNAAICERLSISRATLRTHLNNVYSKCRENGANPDFIPANRTGT